MANNLGYVLLEQGRWPEAEVFLHESRNLWEKIPDRLMLANTLGSLAEVAAALGQTGAARTTCDQSIRMLREYPDSAYARERLQEIEALRERLDP